MCIFLCGITRRFSRITVILNSFKVFIKCYLKGILMIKFPMYVAKYNIKMNRNKIRANE